ncbi:MAG: hypothetical protein K0S53_2250 [Bacteroidetes bacterium]|nr:hypothetical protein [Bacteroidota bacterium]MDF2452017.1 hypothetical protein [Bacteroidota bacterium]
MESEIGTDVFFIFWPFCIVGGAGANRKPAVINPVTLSIINNFFLGIIYCSVGLSQAIAGKKNAKNKYDETSQLCEYIKNNLTI